jgi:hypothetical protein
MNAIQDLEELLKFQHDMQTPYFAAYNDKYADTTRAGDNYRNEDNTIEAGQIELRSFINRFSKSGCNFLIWFSDKKAPQKGGYRVQFYLPANAQSVQPQQIGAITPQVNVDEAIEKALANYKREQQIEILERELAEQKRLLKEQKPTGLDRIFDRLEPIVPHLISGFMKSMPALAPSIGTVQLPNQNHSTVEKTELTPEIENELQQRTETAVVTIAEKFPNNYVEIFETIARWAENESELPQMLDVLQKLQVENPNKYNMAKGLL